MPIRILDAATVGRIAAGEVVERPSSVVKELMENSIDAGATSITVEIKGGGIDYLRVTDNGCGIEPGQVRLAFENHATSKLQSAEQLHDIRTLGFRGEALPSIASVAKVEMTTRARNQDTGMKLTIEGGENMQVREAGCPEGTTFIMKDLFFNIPVRRAFLKKPSYEGGLVSDAVARMILGNPGISIRFINNGTNVYHSFGDGKLRHAVFAVHGKNVAERMVEVDASEGGTRIYGLIGVGELARSSRAHQMFFINGRSVRCALLTKALEEVCRSRVTIGMYPMCALNIVIPPTSVDVNVHPNKLEVRFRDEIQMRMAAERLLATAFEGEKVLQLNPDADSMRSVDRVSTVSKIVTPEDEKIPASVAVVRSDGLQEEKAAPEAAAKVPMSEKQAETQTSPETHPEKTPMQEKADVAVKTAVSYRPENPAPMASVVRAEPAREKASSDKNEQMQLFRQDLNAEIQRIGRRTDGVLRESTVNIPVNPIQTDAAKAQSTTPLVKPAAVKEETKAQDDLPYRVIGVFAKTYILVEANDSLLLIDQHAAHERLQYEKFMAQLEAGSGSQQLLTPIIVHLSAREMALIQDNMEVLEEAGYAVEPFGEMDIQVRAVPYVMGRSDLKPAFMDLINSLNRLRNATIDARRAEVIQMACKSAIKAGDPLSDSEVHALIQQMLSTGAPPTCPHGRPVMKSIPKRELEKMFKRIQ